MSPSKNVEPGNGGLEEIPIDLPLLLESHSSCGRIKDTFLRT